MKSDAALLLHMRDAIVRIRDYTREGRAAFFADPKTQDAVVRNLEIIGEAAKNLSAGARALEAAIPWKQIAGMRDTLIHRYFGVKLEIVWEVVARDIDPLSAAIARLLPMPPPDEPAPSSIDD